MITWKEPLAVRLQYIKLEPAFQPKRVLLLLCYLLLTPVYIAAVYFYFRPELRRYPQRVIDMGLVYMVGLSVITLGSWGFSIFVHRFEATYSLDDKGITIRRFGFSRLVPWRYARNVEIMPHPTIENVSLLTITSGTSLNRQVEKIPFETGQINEADVDEIRKSLGRKKRRNG